jgi:hypothetical protein
MIIAGGDGEGKVFDLGEELEQTFWSFDSGEHPELRTEISIILGSGRFVYTSNF